MWYHICSYGCHGNQFDITWLRLIKSSKEVDYIFAKYNVNRMNFVEIIGEGCDWPPPPNLKIREVVFGTETTKVWNKHFSLYIFIFPLTEYSSFMQTFSFHFLLSFLSRVFNISKVSIKYYVLWQERRNRHRFTNSWDSIGDIYVYNTFWVSQVWCIGCFW